MTERKRKRTPEQEERHLREPDYCNCFECMKGFDEEMQREIAMEEGMLHGVNAYNDAMGWGSEPYEDEQ